MDAMQDENRHTKIPNNSDPVIVSACQREDPKPDSAIMRPYDDIQKQRSPDEIRHVDGVAAIPPGQKNGNRRTSTSA